MSHPNEKLPVAALERIDDLCSAFENAWRSGGQPEIEATLMKAGSPPERDALLAELLALDFDYRRRRGEQPETTEYCQRFPEDTGVVQKALSMDEQATKKSSRFEPPTVAHIARLFPTLEIVELIGAGGMGAVYKARQKGLDRLVALKILPDEISHDVKFALRFTREARALARLNHPHIVSVFEFGNADGTYYFLMEFVDGSTLRDVMQSGELRPEQALAIVPHLCEALQYAHDQGVVHRDIKPENILLDKNGKVKIADFGLSRLLGSESQEEVLTGTHQVMGTLRYMAPEQMEGAHQVDHRADIYSLGVVFYEMLTGELPLGRFAAPSEKVHLDVRLDEVVLRTLEQEPGRRYQHASQVKSDLDSIASTPEQPIAPASALDAGTAKREAVSKSVSLEQQELAARVLLLRRELMSRVEKSLRPLFWGQIIQMVFGVAFIVIGVICWAPNQGIPHRLVSGIVLQVYGTLMVISAGMTCGRIKRVDYSMPVDGVRDQLDGIRRQYLRAGGLIGFAWWLMWFPLAIAVGFDVVMLPGCFWPSMVVGVIGFAASMAIYIYVIRSKHPNAEKWTRVLQGESLAAASQALEEIASTEVM